MSTCENTTHESYFIEQLIHFNFLWIDICTIAYSSEKQPALIIFRFSIEKGVFPWIQKKKHIFGHRACLQVKGRTYFSKKSDYTGKAANFFNVHASCTVSMCHVKLPKGTNYTIKKITIKIKSHQDDGWMLLLIIILGFDLKWLLQLKH